MFRLGRIMSKLWTSLSCQLEFCSESFVMESFLVWYVLMIHPSVSLCHVYSLEGHSTSWLIYAERLPLVESLSTDINMAQVCTIPSKNITKACKIQSLKWYSNLNKLVQCAQFNFCWCLTVSTKQFHFHLSCQEYCKECIVVLIDLWSIWKAAMKHQVT